MAGRDPRAPDTDRHPSGDDGRRHRRTLADSGDGGWTWYRRGAIASIAPVVASTAASWALEHPATAELASWTAF